MTQVRVRKILAVGGEGGGISMIQEVGGQGRYRVAMQDLSMTMIDESEGGAVLRQDSGWLNTWEEALVYFGTWPWPMLVPVHVDEEYAERVLAAIPKVSEQKRLPMNDNRMGRWKAACEGKGR